MSTHLPLVKVAGISASGKSTLVQGLREAGYDARSVSQEHSQVADMWRRIRPPAVLIYLDVTLDAQRQRRPDVSWGEANLETERERLAHAHTWADLRIDTSSLAAGDTLAAALAFLVQAQIAHSPAPLPPAPATGGASPGTEP